MRDVRPGLAAGKTARESAPGTDGSYNRQPDPVSAVRAMGIEIGCKVAGQNPENPDPDGDMEHAVIVLVLFTLDNFFHE
jgi:hypothetical protein